MTLTKGQWGGALIFSLNCAWTDAWANDRNAGDLGRHRAHCDVIVMYHNEDASIRAPWLHSQLRRLWKTVPHWNVSATPYWFNFIASSGETYSRDLHANDDYWTQCVWRVSGDTHRARLVVWYIVERGGSVWEGRLLNSLATRRSEKIPGQLGE